MSGWVAVADLLDLRGEFNDLGPARDKGADGLVGDAAHQAESSDHNPDDTPGSRTPHTDSDSIPEVHALDVDSSGPWLNGATMDKAFAVVMSTMRLLGPAAPLAYAIWNRKIYYNPTFLANPYDGDDPHTNHAHFSSRYGSGSGSSNPENYTGSWGIREAFLMLSPEDKAWFISQTTEIVDRSVGGVFKQLPGDAAYPGRTAGTILLDLEKLRDVLVGDLKGTANAVNSGAYAEGSPLHNIVDAVEPVPPVIEP